MNECALSEHHTALAGHDMGGEASYSFPDEPAWRNGEYNQNDWVRYMDAVAMVLFFMHAMVSTVLLLNMLIAMMGVTLEAGLA